VHFAVFSDTVDVLKSHTEDIDVRFLLDRVRMAVAVVLTAVLRASEIVDNVSQAAANRAPILMSDVYFTSGSGSTAKRIQRNHDGTTSLEADYAETKMPPIAGPGINPVRVYWT
jgi:hypothetical protein